MEESNEATCAETKDEGSPTTAKINTARRAFIAKEEGCCKEDLNKDEALVVRVD